MEPRHSDIRTSLQLESKMYMWRWIKKPVPKWVALVTETWTKTCGVPLLFNFEPHPCGCGSKPSGTGEHQNMSYMGVHPSQNGGIGYDPWPCHFVSHLLSWIWISSSKVLRKRISMEWWLRHVCFSAAAGVTGCQHDGSLCSMQRSQSNAKAERVRQPSRKNKRQ